MGNLAKALRKKGIEIKVPDKPKKDLANIQKVQKNMARKMKQSNRQPATPSQLSDRDLKKLGAHYSDDIVFWHKRSGRISEQYRTLKNHLLAHYKDQPFSLIITSATQKEGKSVTCVNLGFALADGCERKVLVVDCDFRKRGVGKLMGNGKHDGIAEIFQGTKKIKEVIVPTACRNLSVLHAGNLTESKIAGFLGNSQLESVVKELRKQFDCILFDTPAVTMLSDASAVGRIVGNALLVVKLYKTKRRSVDEAIKRLGALNVSTVGVVLTGLMQKQEDYLYRSTE